MSSMRRLLTTAVVVVIAATGLLATATGSTHSAAAYKIVIAPPVATPAKAVAGKPFVVTYKVTRSDTGKPLTTGTMICDPSAAGKTIAHTESFKKGLARLAFTIPTSAKLLKVKVVIKSGGQSATKVSAFKITAAALPSLSIANASVVEGNSGTASLSFPVTLSAKSTDTVSVDYATSDGTATAPTDYTAASGTLIFRPGQIAKTIVVPVIGDTTPESDETLAVSLSRATGASIADSTGAGTITNDDPVPRSGHYSGTTSQGFAISFDVSSQLTYVSNLSYLLELRCVASSTFTQRGDHAGDVLVRPDLTFGLIDDFTQPWSPIGGTRSVTYNFSGQLSAPGSASGTARLVFSYRNSAGAEVNRCDSGTVTWTAT